MGDFLLDSLQDSGNNPITINPQWSFAERDGARRMIAQALGGKQRTWDWHDFKQFNVPLTWVTSADRFRINQWWRDLDTVTLTLNSSADQSTVRTQIINNQLPLGRFHRPYQEFWQGALSLRAVDAASFQGQVFVLDDNVLGLTDKDYNALG